ncbi:YqiA/YcfP family alpha/beta fold hydrolase [Phytohalomonas tamaricis]|uniref:YqiA/YcfP family alpha/beta fold hydrolase n=1 Tax=Phytohalomonas tamaricis TaxID=2081032 RepID=UPI000D0BB5BB|nr:YqiA/YcfP family alpha/beta fold hydrolase [Phytohalomonas tamaricis]
MNDRIEAVDNVLFLHGFNSHPTSHKAMMTRRACEQALPQPCFSAPFLGHCPREALQTAEQALTELTGRTLIVGSSMGGFLATCLAERYDVAAIALINPAVRPSRIAAEMVGSAHENPFTGEQFVIEAHFEDDLKCLECHVPRMPERYLVLLSTQDETLDCRDAFALYRGSRFLISPGDDHGLSQYPAFVPAVLAHGGLTLPEGACWTCDNQ